MELLMFLLGLIVGFSVASWSVNTKWSDNWMRQQRIEYCGSLYKVIRFDRWNESVGNLVTDESKDKLCPKNSTTS